TSTYTGLLLEPYADRPDTTGIGVPIYPAEKIKAAVLAANKAGLSVRLHCIADGSVRMALDIFECSKKMGYVNPSIRNTIEHIENIHPADIPRFAELNVIPSIQPYHLTLDCNEKISRLGRERCRWEWPLRSLVDSGAKVAIGTDFPVVDINPFKTIYAALTRCDDEGNPTGINPEERLTLSQILCAYTSGSANAYGREDLGTLEAGKLADIVVIDRNLFEIEPMEILKAQVKLTIMDGKIVFNRENL
ncbi:MAG TPA: amidohydrolase family protein, partial [Clostridiales bacterium]|nr:amidohydrolase family protein [Clostridiales bacterium]